MRGLTAVDLVLLTMEWSEANTGPSMSLVCLQCWSEQPNSHKPGCTMDLALSERGFPTQAERDRARQSVLG